ncbi:phospholipid carrier-dependent glycosyltransferase [Candidatus Parcubacteria bacterium]|jgi:dolichyl-phosphate-mannose--protein O-mannosyl transferase|nr:MAG: phospholipid carrier-dependent glycosyltransferase [Candidatus Parcubacteria bacterium]
MNRKTKFLLLGILLLSIILHAWRLDIPNHAVFDEVHYATYATQYVTKTPFFDIHPPLGKFIYSLPLNFVSVKSLVDAPFVKLTRDGIVKYELINRTFTTFPYIPLRAISSFFGVLLVLAVFLFMRELTKNDTIALLSAFFVTLENSLLIETRFILLDGVFLSFSFLALWQFLKYKDTGIISGIMWGCALATKLVGIIFLPFIFFKKFGFWKNYKFITIGLLTLGILWIGIQWFSFPTKEWHSFTNSVNANVSQELPKIPEHLSLGQNISLKTYLLFHEVIWSAQGYSSIQATHPAQSRWIEWPFMIGSFCYKENIPLCMIGNPTLWGIGFLSVITTLFYVTITRMRKKMVDKNIMYLYGGYIALLLPFALIPRYMFIYHYFPALIFSFCLSAYWIVKLTSGLEKKYQFVSYAILFTIICIGFIAIAPVTFGLK